MNKSLECRNSEIGEFRFKENNGARNFKKHRIERDVNKLSVCSLTTLKSKFNSDFRLHVHLGAPTETIEGYPTHYCAVFYLGMLDCLNRYQRWHRDFKQRLCGVSSDTDALDITHEENNLNKAMFIGVINVSKKGQCSVPCLIRLQVLNNCPLIISQSTNVSTNLLTFEDTFTVADGEIDWFIERGVLEKPKLPEQVVKRRPQIIADIANEQGKIGGDIFQLLKPEQALSCLSLSYKVTDDLIGLTLQEPLHQVINDLEMFVSSAEFEERAVKRMHMLYYPISYYFSCLNPS